MTELLPLNTSPLPVKLRIADYLTLDAAGAFDAYRKTELLAGEILYMNAQHRPHALAKIELYDALRDALRELGSPLRPMVEASVALSVHDAPEPDLLLTSEPAGDGLVPVSSVALVVEVADASLHSDLTRKQAIYADAAIPEYWIVDLGARVIHQMWMPALGGYGARRAVAFGAAVTAETIAGVVVETARL